MCGFRIVLIILDKLDLGYVCVCSSKKKKKDDQPMHGGLEGLTCTLLPIVLGGSNKKYSKNNMN